MVSRSNYLVVVAAIAALVLFGCDKKEDEFVPPPPPAAKKKAVDIFDEFYVDDAKKGSTASAVKDTPAKTGSVASVSSSGSYKFNPNGRYVVQVNSTASQGGAQRMVNKLKNTGFPAYIAEVENPTPELTGLYFRVRIGGFDALSEAKAFAESALKPDGYDYWVDRKANDNVGIQGAGFGAYQQQTNQYQQYQAPAQPAQTPAPAAAHAPAPAAQPTPAVPPPAPQHVPAPTAQPAPKQAAPAPHQAAPAQKQATPTPHAAPAPANDWGNTATDWGDGDW
jgi:cell division septation protein DedD